MFLRTTRVTRPDGTVDEYIRLVESEWNAGRPRHRVICNLGRKALLAPHTDALLRLLQGQPTRSAAQPAATETVPEWGSFRVFVVQIANLAIFDYHDF